MNSGGIGLRMESETEASVKLGSDKIYREHVVHDDSIAFYMYIFGATDMVGYLHLDCDEVVTRPVSRVRYSIYR